MSKFIKGDRVIHSVDSTEQGTVANTQTDHGSVGVNWDKSGYEVNGVSFLTLVESAPKAANILIGLTGLARHGKGAVAAHLVEHHGFVKMSFADELKAMARRIDPILDVRKGHVIRLADVWEDYAGNEDHIKQFFPEYRRFLQHLGTDGIRSVDPEFWVKRLADRILAHRAENANSRIVVDDVRFPNEAALFLDLWRVSRPDYHIAGDAHLSERFVGMMDENRHLKNNGTLEDLGILVDAVVNPMLQESV